jgi:hypothetical protein
MPDRDTLERCVAQHDDFRKAYELAQSFLLDFLQDETFEIVDDTSGDWVEKVRRGRTVVRVRNRQHLRRCLLRAAVREWVLDRRMAKTPVKSTREGRGT